MTTLSRKMLGYALGRSALASDRPLLREMTAAGGDATIADLATRIVTSRQFRTRSGDSAVAAAGSSDAEPKHRATETTQAGALTRLSRS